jgi:hypothetical protein
MTEQSQAIMPSHPPAGFVRVANPVMRALLRTPVMGSVRSQFMVLSFTGRKTGRRYSVPVSAHRIGNNLYALTDAQWRWNFRDGATAIVLVDGTSTSMRGELIDDPDVVGGLCHLWSESYGVKTAQRSLGMKFRYGLIPTRQEFVQAAKRGCLIAVKLTPRDLAPPHDYDDRPGA